MADSRSKRRGEALPLPPRPPRRPPQQPRGQTEEEILRDRSGLSPLARYPMMTSEDPGYIMGGPQMSDPYNFEFMRRQKEKRESEGIRLKKGGPVKKYQKGGAVEDSKDKYPSERSSLKKELARTRQRRADMDIEVDPTGDREAVMSAPFQVQRPSAFYPLTGRDYVGPRQQMERERARREAEVQRRGDAARRSLDDRISTMESSLSEMGTKENKQNYRKGGPVKKMAKGGVTNKKFIQQAIKKPGALRAQLGAKPGQNIPAKKLAAAAKAPGKLGQRARFAQTLAKMKDK